jgi:hypothetical protein
MKNKAKEEISHTPEIQEIVFGSGGLVAVRLALWLEVRLIRVKVSGTDLGYFPNFLRERDSHIGWR